MIKQINESHMSSIKVDKGVNIRSIIDFYINTLIENLVIFSLSGAILRINSRNNYFKIPDLTYNIPVNEFFKWYDEKLESKWKIMSEEDLKDYFNNMSIKEIWKTYLEELDMSDKDKKIINGIFDTTYIQVQTGDFDDF